MDAPQELDIKRYLRLLHKRRYACTGVAALIMTATICASYVMPERYEARSTVLIEKNFMNDLIRNIAVTPGLEDRVRTLSFMVKDRELLGKVIDSLDMDAGRKSGQERERLIGRFRSNTEIKLVLNKITRRDMDSFTVSYTDEDPVLARDYVNTLVRYCIEENLSTKREERYGANRFLSDQIALFKEKIDRVEAAIVEVTMEEGAVRQDRLVELQKKLDSLLAQYTEDFPEVVRVKAEIGSLRERQRSMRRAASTARGARTGVPADGTVPPDPPEGSSQGREGGEPAASKKLSDLERERDAYKKIYEDLLAALGRSEVSTQMEVQDKAGTFRIIEPATLPLRPVTPDRARMIFLGIVAGLAGGIAIVFVLDYFDDSVKNVEALKEFGVPVLAVIPRIQNARETLRQRRRDLLLYGCAGLYLLGVLAVLTKEFLGL